MEKVITEFRVFSESIFEQFVLFDKIIRVKKMSFGKTNIVSTLSLSTLQVLKKLLLIYKVLAR